MSLDVSAVSSALLAMLRSELAPIKVGDGEPPVGVGASAEDLPYAVFFPISGGQSRGPLFYIDADLMLPYQVTSVGVSRLQAETLKSKVAEAMIGTVAGGGPSVPVNGTGFEIFQRRLTVASGGAIREGSVWNAHDTFSVWASVA